jgi:glycine/D-amino acid oxidase-like deaminating enzyme
VAAGIIHPITGRRIVKTWMVDTLFPAAESTYREIEKHFHEQLFFRKNILELIHSAKEQNDWSIKCSSPEMKNYFSDEKTQNLYSDVLTDDPKKISIAQAGWLNVARMIQLFRKQLKENNMLLDEDFIHDQLSLHADGVTYKNIHADKIIFCEGYHASQNPFWKHLPFLPAKGEVLTIHSDQLNLDHIVTKTIFILPLGNHLFKVGSTYSWGELNEEPTEKAKNELVSQLKKIINVPFEVVDHKAAVRPTVKDRRPFIGLHPNHPQVGIFNGLGTKGVLLAPYFANHFAEHLVNSGKLMEEADVKRFSI